MVGTRRVLAAFAGLAVVATLAVTFAPRPWVRLRSEALRAERAALERQRELLVRRLGADLESGSQRLQTEAAALSERLEVQEVEREISELESRRQVNRYEARRKRAGDGGTAEEIAVLRREREALDELLAAAEDRRAHLLEELTAARRSERTAGAELRRIEARLAGELPPGGPGWSSAPGEAEEVRPPGLTVRAGGVRRARLDRCVTCHLAAVRAREPWGGDVWLRPHPQPELFLSPESPHPLADFGCSVCHGGDGRRLDLVASGHGGVIDPSGEQACRICHGESPATADGRAADLIVARGCDGCHASAEEALDELPAPGPPLAALALRRAPPSIRADLERPTAAGGHRPGFPGLSSLEREALAAALEELAPTPPAVDAPTGDPERGARLVAELGCGRCHRASGPARRLEPAVDERDGRARLLAAPHRLAAASMPDLRLSEEERGDLLAYLAGEAPDPDSGDPARPSASTDDLDRSVAAILDREHTLEEVAQILGSESRREKLLRLGRERLVSLGCGGCHPGPDGRQTRIAGPIDPGGSPDPGTWHQGPAAPELALTAEEGELLQRTVRPDLQVGIPAWRRARESHELRTLAEGRRLAVRLGCGACHRLDRAAAPPSTAAPDLVGAGARLRPEWILAWLEDPGRRPLDPRRRLRMPTYGIGEEERMLLVRWLAVRDRAPVLVGPAPSTTFSEREVGRLLFDVLQCERCHADEVEPALRAPRYAGSRERLRPDWVHEWLLDPHAVAPGTPMPAILVDSRTGTTDTSHLLDALDTPVFAAQRRELVRAVSGEEELERLLGDPDRVAAALRAHLFSLESE